MPLAPERHREIVPWITRDGGLHPYHATGTGISFQRRNSCRVRSDEPNQSRIVPVKNNYSIITEINGCQVCWRKHCVSMPGSGDGVFNDGSQKRIVIFEQCEFICRGLAQRKRVLNRVCSELRVPSVSRKTAG